MTFKVQLHKRKFYAFDLGERVFRANRVCGILRSRTPEEAGVLKGTASHAQATPADGGQGAAGGRMSWRPHCCGPSTPSRSALLAVPWSPRFPLQTAVHSTLRGVLHRETGSHSTPSSLDTVAVLLRHTSAATFSAAPGTSEVCFSQIPCHLALGDPMCHLGGACSGPHPSPTQGSAHWPAWRGRVRPPGGCGHRWEMISPHGKARPLGL